MTPEFSRLYALDTIGTAVRTETIVAAPGECAALATRFGLISIEHLKATAQLVSTTLGYTAKGQLTAGITQSCIASAAPVVDVISEAFTIRFIAEAEMGEGDEIELDANDCDVMAHDGRMLDLGEAVAQSLALALNPFPRAKGAADLLREAGVVGEDEVVTGPFAGLKGLLNP
jgi:uncharacterized metal-binding protein YceD (DUF177 family)